MTPIWFARVGAGCGAAIALVLGLGACGARAQPFDSYTLSLSWSPTHCAETRDNSAQCDGTRLYGFVLHGLWPESDAGRSPEHCAGPALDPAAVTAELRSIMPSDRLIEHEWTTHGTCSGMRQSDYFRTAVRAFRMVRIPREFQQPMTRVETTPRAVRDEFAGANPDFPADAFAVKDDGRFLEEVRVCLTPALKPLPCLRPGDRSGRRIIVRPVR